MSSNLTDKVNELRKSVLAKRPQLAAILQKDGERSLLQYAERYFTVETPDFFAPYKLQAIEAIAAETERLFDAERAAAVREQLQAYYMVSTADHLGPLSQTYFVNSNLVAALAGEALHDERYKHVIVLASANVAFNNPSFPRGLVYHSDTLPDNPLQRLLLISNNAKPNLVYGYPAYGKERLEALRADFRSHVGKGLISAAVAKRLQELLHEVYEAPGVTELSYYSDQVVQSNTVLWKRLLLQTPATYPDLIYLELEKVVERLLITDHFDKPTAIHRLLFQEEGLEAFTRHYEGIQGAFSLAEHWGTFLFWVLPKGRRQRLALVREGNELVATDQSWRVTLTPEAIKRALQNQELIPSVALVLTILAFQYGMTCLGGLSQTTYLGDMGEAFATILDEWGDHEHAAAVRLLKTDLLCDNFSVAYLKKRDGRLTVATGPDLVLYAVPDAYNIIAQTAATLTVAEAMDTMLSDSYRFVYPAEADRKPELSALTAEDCIEALNLQAKVASIGSLP